MSRVLVPVADGSEEMEAVTMIDIFRRAEMAVTVASVMTGKQITASRKVNICADRMIEECANAKWDLIALPGGMPGAEILGGNPCLLELLKQQQQNGKWLAAVCASPAVVLGRSGLIKDYMATSYPAFETELKLHVKEVVSQPVVIDRNLVTSQGPGTAMMFALTLVELLEGRDKAKDVAAGLLVAF